MNVVYSYLENNEDVLMGGYRNRENFLYGLSLSVMLANEYYDPVLYTGLREWKVIKEAKLPWHRVHIVNFDQYDIPKGLWNFSKFVALDREDPPFVHIDNDVFIFEELPEFDEMLFQERENTNEERLNYKNSIDYLESNREECNLPSVWDKNIQHACHCSFIGCKNEEFVDKWMSEVNSWIFSECFDEVVANEFFDSDDHNLSSVVEQYLAGCVDKDFGFVSNFLVELTDDFTIRFKHLDRNSYVHTVGLIKREEGVEREVREILYSKYPRVYKRIR